MNPGLYLEFLASQARVDRREALELAAKSGLAGAIAALGVTAMAAPARANGQGGGGNNDHGDRFTDDVFDYANPANLGKWAPSRYGKNDQRGSFNEVTPDKTAAALRLLDCGRKVKTYNLGELVWNGFPAFVTTPARGHHMRMTVTGYTPPRLMLHAQKLTFTHPRTGRKKTCVAPMPEDFEEGLGRLRLVI